MAKVFLLTALLLFGLSLVVYGLLAWLMPQTYSHKLNASLDEQTVSFLAGLEEVAFSDSGGLFDQFARNREIYSMELYDDNGVLIPLPSAQAPAAYGETSLAGYGEGNVALSAEEETGEDAPVLAGHYYFSFGDSQERYLLLVYGKAGQIAELQQAFLRLFPFLSAVVLLVSLLVSWIYSRMITKPVLEISRISEEMSELHLEWQLDGSRTDELGTLEKSLNLLSHNLSAALSDLQDANKKLEDDIEREKKLEQARTDFFSAVSHELKTPITVIKGQLEGMLLGIGAYKDHGKYLARSLEVANTLEAMVQEILTISRLDAAGADFKKDNFDCVQVIRRYLSETEDLMAEKDLQICLWASCLASQCLHQDADGEGFFQFDWKRGQVFSVRCSNPDQRAYGERSIGVFR